MRILSVCSNFRVFGAEIITLKLIEGFKQNGHEQLAVTSIWTDGEFSHRLNTIGVPEIQLALGALTKKISLRTGWWMANTLGLLPGAWIRWARVLRRFRPDVIVFTNSRQCLLLYPWLKRQPSFLVEYTNVQPSDWNRRLYTLLSPRLSAFVAVSQFMKEHLCRIGASPGRVCVIKSAAFSAADFPKIANDTEQPKGFRKGRLRIGIVGQISPHKGHFCLAESIRILNKEDSKVDVFVTGSGNDDDVRELKQRIEAAGLADSFHWRGYQRNKADIYSGIDVCVVPSCFGDPFPTVAMEAAAYGLPVIASRAGGLPEIVQDGVTGWLVEPNDSKQLAQKIEWILQHPAKAAAMGAAGRERVRREFTMEKMVAEFEALFQKHINSQNARGAAAPLPNSTACKI